MKQVQRKPGRQVTTRATVRIGRSVVEGTVLDCDFVYDPGDPFAMSLLFHVGGQAPIRWTFSRDLFVQGVNEPTGVGDVVVSPWLSEEGCAEVAIWLRSPDGHLQTQARRRDVDGFVTAMLAAVPLGEECTSSGFETEVDTILG